MTLSDLVLTFVSAVIQGFYKVNEGSGSVLHDFIGNIGNAYLGKHFLPPKVLMEKKRFINFFNK